MKSFMVIDKSGRSAKPYTLSESHIRKTWDLEKTDENSEMPLGEFLDECMPGDTWRTNSVKVTCI